MVHLQKSKSLSGTTGMCRSYFHFHLIVVTCECLYSTSTFYLFRGMSTVHAIFITVMSVYLVFFSNLFSDQLDGPVTFRSSNLSNFTLGVNDAKFHFHSRIVYAPYAVFSFCLIPTEFLICPGFCWVLHHGPCYDILGISFSWWNGVCK
jgi:hypothetical protein